MGVYRVCKGDSVSFLREEEVEEGGSGKEKVCLRGRKQ